MEELLSRVDTMATAGRLEEAVEQLPGAPRGTQGAAGALYQKKQREKSWKTGHFLKLMDFPVVWLEGSWKWGFYFEQMEEFHL